MAKESQMEKPKPFNKEKKHKQKCKKHQHKPKHVIKELGNNLNSQVPDHEKQSVRVAIRKDGKLKQHIERDELQGQQKTCELEGLQNIQQKKSKGLELARKMQKLERQQKGKSQDKARSQEECEQSSGYIEQQQIDETNECQQRARAQEQKDKGEKKKHKHKNKGVERDQKTIEHKHHQNAEGEELQQGEKEQEQQRNDEEIPQQPNCKKFKAQESEFEQISKQELEQRPKADEPNCFLESQVAELQDGIQKLSILDCQQLAHQIYYIPSPTEQNNIMLDFGNRQKVEIVFRKREIIEPTRLQKSQELVGVHKSIERQEKSKQQDLERQQKFPAVQMLQNQYELACLQKAQEIEPKKTAIKSKPSVDVQEKQKVQPFYQNQELECLQRAMEIARQHNVKGAPASGVDVKDELKSQPQAQVVELQQKSHDLEGQQRVMVAECQYKTQELACLQRAMEIELQHKPPEAEQQPVVLKVKQKLQQKDPKDEERQQLECLARAMEIERQHKVQYVERKPMLIKKKNDPEHKEKKGIQNAPKTPVVGMPKSEIVGCNYKAGEIMYLQQLEAINQQNVQNYSIQQNAYLRESQQMAQQRPQSAQEIEHRQQRAVEVSHQQRAQVVDRPPMGMQVQCEAKRKTKKNDKQEHKIKAFERQKKSHELQLEHEVERQQKHQQGALEWDRQQRTKHVKYERKALELHPQQIQKGEEGLQKVKGEERQEQKLLKKKTKELNRQRAKEIKRSQRGGEIETEVKAQELKAAQRATEVELQRKCWEKERQQKAKEQEGLRSVAESEHQQQNNNLQKYSDLSQKFKAMEPKNSERSQNKAIKLEIKKQEKQDVKNYIKREKKHTDQERKHKPKNKNQAQVPSEDEEFDEKRAHRVINISGLRNARKGWIVKLPKYVIERWNKLPLGSEVGTVRIVRPPTNRADTSPAVLLKMSEAALNADIFNPIPSMHVLENIPAQQHNAAVYGERSNGKFGIRARVVNRLDGRPAEVDQVYLDMKKRERLQLEANQRTIGILDVLPPRFLPVSDHPENIEHRKKKKAAGKRVRSNKTVVMDMLFDAFEKHQYYKLNDLVNLTNQPVNYLKSILREYCTFNTKDPHKYMWELKTEYRRYLEEDNEKSKNRSKAKKELPQSMRTSLHGKTTKSVSESDDDGEFESVGSSNEGGSSDKETSKPNSQIPDMWLDPEKLEEVKQERNASF
ncbi:trichohyalin-like [Scaptodrosophila lebanonensis]|uniref:General transcription factor IIF subunit 2 n=1 Tax=Drosophila lebanonensis TaxID=7225 RepID=A0A6J2U367_DROLE|nr:trichohyalin-like [Scaptodrosophila lebanonensis]